MTSLHGFGQIDSNHFNLKISNDKIGESIQADNQSNMYEKVTEIAVGHLSDHIDEILKMDSEAIDININDLLSDIDSLQFEDNYLDNKFTPEDSLKSEKSIQNDFSKNLSSLINQKEKYKQDGNISGKIDVQIEICSQGMKSSLNHMKDQGLVNVKVIHGKIYTETLDQAIGRIPAEDFSQNINLVRLEKTPAGKWNVHVPSHRKEEFKKFKDFVLPDGSKAECQIIEMSEEEYAEFKKALTRYVQFSELETRLLVIQKRMLELQAANPQKQEKIPPPKPLSNHSSSFPPNDTVQRQVKKIRELHKLHKKNDGSEKVKAEKKSQDALKKAGELQKKEQAEALENDKARQEKDNKYAKRTRETYDNDQDAKRKLDSRREVQKEELGQAPLHDKDKNVPLAKRIKVARKDSRTVS